MSDQIEKFEEKNTGLISLKEAAEMSGYSADYVGQLIRSGKIPGKQVCAQIAWMTTAEAVLDYKNNSQKVSKNINNDNPVVDLFRKIKLELSVFKLFFKTFKSAAYYLLVLLAMFSLLVYYLVNIFASEKIVVPEKQRQDMLVY